MTDRFYLVLVLAIGVLGLIFIVAPWLRLRGRLEKLKKLEVWYESGPKLGVTQGSDSAIKCNFCGNKNIKRSFVGSYTRKDYLRQVENVEVDEARFYEHRCLKCGSLVYKEKVSLIDPKTKTSFENNEADFSSAKRLFLDGLKAAETHSYGTAESAFLNSLKIIPDRTSTLSNLATVQFKLNKFHDALISSKKAVEIDPGNQQGWLICGMASFEIKEYDKAEIYFNKSLSLDAECHDALLGVAKIKHIRGKRDEALTDYLKVVSADPSSAKAYFGIGTLMLEMNKYEDSIFNYKKVISLDRNFPNVYNSLGSALRAVGELDMALEFINYEIKINHSNYAAYNNRGNLYFEKFNYDSAIDDYEKAYSLNSNYPDTLYNYALALIAANRDDEALGYLDKLIDLQSDNSDAHRSRGHILKKLNRLPEAINSFERSHQLSPDAEYLFGEKLHCQMFACDWSKLGTELENAKIAIDKGDKVVNPFITLSLFDDPLTQLNSAKTRSKSAQPPKTFLPIAKQNGNCRKISIAFFSPDLSLHPIGLLCSRFIECMDRNLFSLTAYSFSNKPLDPMQQRIRSSVDRFIDASKLSDSEIIQSARDNQIHIAIDLAGHTNGARQSIFAARCAPLQINYLGYPGTSGIPNIDYIISDHVVIPEEYRKFYSENIIYLPNCFQVSDNSRNLPSLKITRQLLGLPADAFVFCCLNNTYKYNPRMFVSWTRILQNVHNSILWLVADNSLSESNLKAFATVHGIAPERLVVTKRLPLEDYLSSLACADLFLDTLPFNAGTTANDALWVGLPLLTCQGKSFAGRMASSLLMAAGLEELVATNLEEYEAMAIDLANNAGRLASIRNKLANSRKSSPLFNTQQTTRHLEQAFERIHQAWLQGAPLQDISIEA